MTDAPITRKRQMYEALGAGRFGNTTRSYRTVEEWLCSADYQRYEWWGIRSLVPGGPCRLNCPRSEVAATAARPEFQAAGVDISLMIDRLAVVTLSAEVYDSPTGLLVYGIEYPPRGGSWRADMPSRGREYRGLAARLLLRQHLWPSSLEDLWAVFERWPGHVYECSAFDRAVGTVPGRNAICWEVRRY